MVSDTPSSSLNLPAAESLIPAHLKSANLVEIPSVTEEFGKIYAEKKQLYDDASLSDGKKEECNVGIAEAHLSSKEAAAVNVQKVYRSYRTRRHLADSAVMEKKYKWWNVLEGALLQQSSETFYAYREHDTAAARWSRLKKKAAKVGKGLSKDENARKLAIRHWLEAIDARHRYGHNLHYYYAIWEASPTKEPFFYWLDVGEGKEVDLHECSRSTLLKQQIKYLGPKERNQYEVVVDGGKLRYKKSKELVNTPKGDKWIFVMSTSGRLYVAQKKKGNFQHSSFLAGGATKAAGRLLVNHGTLELMEAHSGHYHPTEENFNDLVKVLKELGTDLHMAKVQSVSDDMLYGENDSILSISRRQVTELHGVATTEYGSEFASSAAKL